MQQTSKNPAWRIIIITVALLVTFVVSILLTLNVLSKNTNSTQASANNSGNVVSSPIDELKQPTVIPRKITILSPSANDQVSGQINVKGTLEGSLADLNVSLYDQQQNLLGTAKAMVVLGTSGSTTGDLADWTAVLKVTLSPTTTTGQLKVTTADNSVSSTTDVQFKVLTASDRIKLYTPLENQVITAGNLRFRGQMQGFFEGTMNVNIKNQAGNLITTYAINAEDDNYGQFANFDWNAEVKSSFIPASPQKGTIEFVEMSAKDGSAKVLLTIPVEFK